MQRTRPTFFRETWCKKFTLPDLIDDPVVDDPVNCMSSFILVRNRRAAKSLRQLGEKTATGPDGIPAKILRKFWVELAAPITLLVRLIISAGKWPQQWKEHWLHPIYKKGAVYDPGKYRGVHLTSLISKVVERVVGRILIGFFEGTDAYGTNQWAFRKGRSHSDLIALLVASWILELDKGKKVGIYLSDISGAFDRV